jgi:DMSO/TMAO reductase YedYZ molybdopterin-dependent catalytic subunit
MSQPTRRAWLGALAGTTAFVPPISNLLYAPGEILTYSAQRLVTSQSLAREFPKSMISAAPVANGEPPNTPEYKQHQSSDFKDWQLQIEGLVSRPGSFSIEQLKSYPSSTQITQLICEEGWSYIAEWTGVRLSHVLDLAGIQPHARFVTYHSMEPGWWDTIDMSDALHPQTLVSYSMNSGPIPLGNGGPLRLRVPKQLGYKSVKYINRLVISDTLPEPRKAAGGIAYGYSWYAGI